MKKKVIRKAKSEEEKERKNDFKWYITNVDAIKHGYCAINTYKKENSNKQTNERTNATLHTRYFIQYNIHICNFYGVFVCSIAYRV